MLEMFFDWRFREEFHKRLSQLSARDLAKYFVESDEATGIIVQDYIETIEDKTFIDKFEGYVRNPIIIKKEEFQERES
jgi:hypothetical protein